MENANTLMNEETVWALLDRFAIVFVKMYDPTLSCPTPFSSLIDPALKNRINLWMETQDMYLFQTVISVFLQQISCKREPPELRNPGDRRLRKVCEYVHRHYYREIKLPEMASDIGMTEPAFCRFFKKATGEHFTDYVKKVRIDYAARQLLDTDDTVSGIGYNCGFNTADYFIRKFKEVKGCTPGKYRKLIENRESIE